jgi:excisionase family DNA binding protein
MRRLGTCAALSYSWIMNDDRIAVLTTGEVARLLGLSPDMVRVLDKTRKLPAVKTERGLRLWVRSDVEKFAGARAARKARRQS